MCSRISKSNIGTKRKYLRLDWLNKLTVKACMLPWYGRMDDCMVAGTAWVPVPGGEEHSEGWAMQ